MSDDSKWSQPDQPPPPLFLGEKERNLVKQVNDELIERVIGQQVIYYPIDDSITQYNDLYGEAVEKTFLPPVRVYALVDYQSTETKADTVAGMDKSNTITIYFHKRRLIEDQDLYVREGDFILYGDYYYEIVSTEWSRQLFGQIDHTFEIVATCYYSREGLFDAT
tara:strand:- start:176 stop:670 length:495 start_codon:yes stop_codon:yes gene_type:complete